MTKQKMTKRILALAASASMVSSTMPAPVMAASDYAAIAENGFDGKAGADIGDTITINFPEGISLDMSMFDRWQEYITLSEGNFGTEASLEFEHNTNVATITLGETDLDIAIGRSIEIAGEFLVSEDGSEVENQSIIINGSFGEKVIFKITPEDAIVTIDGFDELQEAFGIGEYSYTIYADDTYEPVSGIFEITEENAGEEIVVEVVLSKKAANYTELEAAVAHVEEINSELYSEASFAVLTEKLEVAKNIPLNLTIDEQGEIDNALAELNEAVEALEPAVAVNVQAIAVCSDVEARYGKADKIVVLFDCPTNGADILNDVTIGGLTPASFNWDKDNSVLTLDIDGIGEIENALLILNENSAFKTADENVIKKIETVALGNFDGSEAEVTPTQMLAVIVKNSDVAGVKDGDCIKVVFNAPMREDIAPEELNSALAGSRGSFDSSRTVYTITLTEGLAIYDNAVLELDDMNTELMGSFGEAVVPSIIGKAKIEDVDGTSKTQGDKLYVTFSAPTNAPEIIFEDGVLAGATAEWTENNTVLVITLGETEVNISDKLDLSAYGIMDINETAYAENTAEIELDGSFGYTQIPSVIGKAKIEDVDGTPKTKGDKLYVTFSAPTNTPEIIFDGVLSGSTAEWKDTGTVLVITLGEGAVTSETKLDLSKYGIMDANGVAQAENTEDIALSGSFGIAIEPRITNAVAYTTGTKHNIKLMFNTKIYQAPDTPFLEFEITPNEGDLNVKSLNYKINKDNATNEINIELDDNTAYFAEGKQYTVTVIGTLLDAETGTIAAKNMSHNISGNFATAIKPEALKAVYVSGEGNGIQNPNDKIIVVFNTDINKGDDVLIRLNNTDAGTYEIHGGNKVVISNFGNIVNVDSVDELQISIKGFVDKSTGSEAMDSVVDMNVEGSFGNLEVPQLLSAIYVSADGSGVQKAGDRIDLVFDTPVNIDGIVSEDGGYTFTITNPQAVPGGSFEISYTSVATGKKYTKTVTVDGSMGNLVEPEVRSVTYISTDGSGVQKAGDKIVLVFSTPVNIDGIVSEDGGYTFTITNPQAVPGGSFEISYTSVATGKKYIKTVTVGGSMGNLVTPKVLSATYVSADGSGVQKAGDKVVLVFNTKVEGVETKIGKTVTTDDNIVFTVTNLDENLAIGKEYSVKAVSMATGVDTEMAKVLSGSKGYAPEISIVSVVAKTINNVPVIDVRFNGRIDIAINETNVNNAVTIFNANNPYTTITKLQNINEDGIVSGIRLTLSNDSGNIETIDLSGLGIKNAVTGEVLKDENLKSVKVSGKITPVVKSCKAESDCVTITFSSPVKAENINQNFNKYTSIYGVGAYAAFEDNNTVLKIYLGEEAGIKNGNNKYVMLTGLGITSALVNSSDEVMGLYLINTGSFTSDKQTVSQVKASSRIADKAEAVKGDIIRIVFESSTNIPDVISLENYISVPNGSLDEFFGTGYTAEWENLYTLAITLGGSTTDEEGNTTGNDPAVKIGDAITVKEISFASGDGKMEETEYVIGGSFSGREFEIIDSNIEQNGDYIVKARIINNLSSTVKPVVACAVYNGNTLTYIFRTSVAVTDGEEVVFDIPATGEKITKAVLYVFDTNFRDVNQATGILADPVTVILSKTK